MLTFYAYIVICRVHLNFACEFGEEGKTWEKSNEHVEEILENERGGLWGVNFSS